MSSIPEQRESGHDNLSHPEWETGCEVLDTGDVIHTGALHLFASRHGVVVVHVVRADDFGNDGEQQEGRPEVRVERMDQPRGPRHTGNGYDPGAEHFDADDAEALAALAEALGDDELAALLRDLGCDV